MHAFRRHRSLGRFLAAWLLLWSLAMAWSASPPQLQAHDHLHGLAPAASVAADDPPCTHDHAAVDVHAGHASGSVAHCPLCTQGAAPPPVLLAAAPEGPLGSEPPPVRLRTRAVGRVELAPPARGPPVLS